MCDSANSFWNRLLHLNQMLYALCLSYHSNTEAVLFANLSSGRATTTGRLLQPKMGNSNKGVLNPNFQSFTLELRKIRFFEMNFDLGFRFL